MEDVLHADTSIRVLPSSAMPSTAIISSPERERGDDIRNVCAHASKFMQHTHEAMDVASVGGRGSKESERYFQAVCCECVCMSVRACLLQRVTVHWVYVPQDASYQHETSQTFLLNHPVARLAPVNELLAFHLWCLCVCLCGCVRPRPEVCACVCVCVCVRHHALAR